MNQKDTIHIQNILKGNKNSEQLIYFKYKKQIKQFIHAKYDKYNQMEDCIDDYVADIMIKIFSNLAKYDEKKSDFRTWVFTITNNHMRNIVRDNNVRRAICRNLRTTTSTNDYIEYETNNSLDFISKQISNDDYTMLSMKYLDGYNYHEIGKEFNTTSTCIANKINYIKTVLKNHKANKHLILD